MATAPATPAMVKGRTVSTGGKPMAVCTSCCQWAAITRPATIKPMAVPMAILMAMLRLVRSRRGRPSHVQMNFTPTPTP